MGQYKTIPQETLEKQKRVRERKLKMANKKKKRRIMPSKTIKDFVESGRPAVCIKDITTQSYRVAINLYNERNNTNLALVRRTDQQNGEYFIIDLERI